MSSSNWIRLQLTVSDIHSETAVAILWDLGTCGVEETVQGNHTTFIAYFSPDLTLQRVRGVLSKLDELKIGTHQADVSWMSFSEDEWIQKWKEQFTGFPVGRTFYIHPGWEDPSPDYPVTILMEPGHAFGSGTHESTQLALSQLTGPAPEATSILDVGTGSGLLLIAAARLSSANTLVGLDNDHQATRVAGRNLLRNRVGNAHLVSGEPVALRSAFDLVLANLTGPVLCGQVHELCRLTARDIVLSGFTTEQKEQVLDAWQEYPFHVRQEQVLRGWVSLLLRRKS